MLPGGGREEGEDETTCVAREVREETGLTVRVDQLLADTPAEPPDGTYVRAGPFLFPQLQTIRHNELSHPPFRAPAV